MTANLNYSFQLLEKYKPEFMKPLVARAQLAWLPIQAWPKLPVTYKGRVLEFTQSLPIRQIAGFGPVDEATIHNVFNISTVADLYLQRRILLQVLNNERKITYYLNAALGFPDLPHYLAAFADMKEPTQKSFSREKTVSRPIVNLTFSRRFLLGEH